MRPGIMNTKYFKQTHLNQTVSMVLLLAYLHRVC